MNTHNRTHRFDNELVLLTEEMNWSETVAVSLLLPVGSAYDPHGKEGLASMTCEMSLRGAGSLDNKMFLQTLENLGIESSEGVTKSYIHYSAAMPADKLDRALELLADEILYPKFPAEELESSTQVLYQELMAIEDEPSRKMMGELGKIFFPDPWGRCRYGTEEGLKAITLDDIHDFHHRFYRPNGAILSVAGRVDWDHLQKKVDSLFCSWQPLTRPEIVTKNSNCFQSHIDFDSTQTHIGLAWPSVPFTHPDYLNEASAVSVLSGGMSCRLFTEVREKRGLCYSVSASLSTLADRGAVFCYCGTSADRAQQSLDVIIEEVDRLSQNGIDREELDRMKIRSKSARIMQLESTVSRARSIAGDWFYLGRIRTMEEIENKINALNCEELNNYFLNHPVKKMRLVSLGTAPLSIDPVRLG